jgi:hypothetical protein
VGSCSAVQKQKHDLLLNYLRSPFELHAASNDGIIMGGKLERIWKDLA